MEALRSKVSEKLSERAADWIVAAITGLLVALATAFGAMALPAVLENLSPRVLLLLLALSAALNVLAGWHIVQLRRKHAMKLRFGVYWDGELEPYCPTCQKPVHGYGQYLSDYSGYRWGFYCSDHKEILMSEILDGNPVTLEVARKCLREGKAGSGTS